ncbi:8-amino-7-oxononanoate synthase [Thauera linaloolentis]|uniref:8-amino-7-oxononanoate synthase n=1 Tax=Thauera linaloolentis (strain DSM 12138 / JCM 21573 / CCUG 41526 / CIP 105981 / IAM 15112 / NBRC 102519 / 47Lol) TaxID=1123367 RepID=N6YBR1_THAL4|nr:8-amino-7-oxononanoate synthase [Thauera linaloolentis]ENO88925.1 8-amino-7-oxononanoate synthase [Thauera linaloolentis 47Lol = DSM 12138]MCM8564780.1 8-amino-7-oxononanoate synthase [Thauera linaloolentis]
MLLAHLTRRRLEREAAALLRRRRVAASPCAPLQTVDDGRGGVRELLNFGSNDYLGLASHPDIAAALADGARRWGAGSGASHLVTGHSQAHALLEGELARLLSPWVPDAGALLFCSGFMANLALLTTLGAEQAAIFADKLNHASLVDGSLLAAARMRRYPHGRLDLLDAMLRDCEQPIRLIVTDAVFSMDGDIAPLAELLALAERHDAWLIVDDAHGFGVLGANGEGALAHCGLRSERLIYMGTLGKAAGVAGAFVAAHPLVVDALLQGGRSYIYTTAMPPALAHALGVSLALISGGEGAARREKLAALTAALRARLSDVIARRPGCGWRLADSATPIQPLIVGDNAAALALAAALDAAGLWVPAIRPPTVPANTARLRITLSAAHTLSDVERLCDALAACRPEVDRHA